MFPLLCARSFLSSVPIKYHLPPDPGYSQPPSSLAARCEICFWAAGGGGGGGGGDEDGGNGGDGDGGNGDGGSGGGDDGDGSVAAVTVAAVASVMIATAAAVALAAMTTSVVATYTMTPGPRRSQTPPRTTAVSAEAAAVVGNAHPAQNTVVPRKASAGAPKLRRGCTTYNHWIAGPCTSPVRGYFRCSSTNMAELSA